jgi:hypothetical protein
MVNAFNDQAVFIGEHDGSPKYAFALARDDQGNRIYHLEQRPSQEGDPDQPFVMYFPFGYLGMGSSVSNRNPDTYEVSECDARFRGRLYPRPVRNTVTITTPSDVIRTLFITRQPNGTEVIYAGGGLNYSKEQISNDTELDTEVRGSGLAYGRAAPWNGKWYLPRTSGFGFLELEVGNGTADTWVLASTGGTTTAVAFTTAVLAGSTTPVLIRGTSTGSISTASATPTDNANWSAVYPIASSTEYVNGLVTHDGNVFVGTTAGLFVVDPNVNGTPLTTHLTNSSNEWAGRPTIEWHGKVYYPHHTGLYRTVNGLTRTVGIETLKEFAPTSTGLRGRVTAMAGTAEWLYVAYYSNISGVGARSWILAGREREPGEPGTGEMVWHTLEGPITGEIGAMCVYQGTDTITPRLYFGLGTALHYYFLGKNGGIDVRLGGDYGFFHTHGSTRMNHDFAPNNLGRPSTLKIAEVIESHSYINSTNSILLQATWDPNADADGPSYTTVGTVSTTGFNRTTFTKGSGDSGRELQLRAGILNTSAVTPTYLYGDALIVRGRERPDQVREVTMVLDLTEGGTVPQGQTLLELEAQLRTWKESGTALTFTDNQSGETFTCRMQEVVRDESESDVGATPGYRVRVRLVEALN